MSLKHCLNWKVIAGLGVIALGVLIVAPNLLGRVLPFLLIAACPLSMLAMAPMMMRSNGGQQHRNRSGERETAATGEALPVSGGMPCCDMATPRRLAAATPDLAALKAEASALAARQEALATAIAQLEGSEPVVEHAR